MRILIEMDEAAAAMARRTDEAGATALPIDRTAQAVSGGGAPPYLAGQRGRAAMHHDGAGGGVPLSAVARLGEAFDGGEAPKAG